MTVIVSPNDERDLGIVSTIFVIIGFFVNDTSPDTFKSPLITTLALQSPIPPANTCPPAPK